jgi:hypothetical protein
VHHVFKLCMRYFDKKSDLLITSKREKIDKVVGLMLLNFLPV